MSLIQEAKMASLKDKIEAPKVEEKTEAKVEKKVKSKKK